mmetsp:Transcript_6460/g.18640  ORF Transcript_6460/g.18640 Transcript_6460/m.18640 type:complete len:421 (+) Transcript_6460:305-1567(+)|eukprot:CAMPEP_0206142464 /NCGR_PEP_ID=MMETSP1473-20131121/16909_1 /ASSEMBLY_ACC=CAM_ASM_001109 /TAXON_ID=1461547 /ORGANISM="Stichococcus sp, Strain RCC1054" /LENGTH=420 /DNA_ID=CAMNT_0053537475 /DNA_START=207 /DNA_END=1469 /DNA_ORIENTATION=-
MPASQEPDATHTGAEVPTQRSRGRKSSQKRSKAEALSQALKQGQEDRALRSAYQNLREQTARDGGDLTNLYARTLADRLQQSNKLSELVQRPREQAVDSEIFANLADAGMSMAKKLTHGGQGVTAKDFLRRLKALHAGQQPEHEEGAEYPEGAFDWVSLGRSVAHLFRPGVGVQCMVGPLGSKAKVRKAIVRHKKEKLADLVRPDDIKEVEEGEKQETDRNMLEIWRLLREHGPSVPLVELVLNPHPDPAVGFCQTVENVFGLSFLVRDGKVSLTKGENGIVMVNRLGKGERGAAAVRTQFMMNQDFETWQRWKACVRHEDCLMPHRQPQNRNGEGASPQTAPAGSDAADTADAPSESEGDAPAPASARQAAARSSGRGKGSGRKARRPSTPPDEGEIGDVEDTPERAPVKKQRRSAKGR